MDRCKFVTRVLDAHVTLGESEFGRLDSAALLAQMDAFGIQGVLAAPGDRWLAVDNREGNDALLAIVRRQPDRVGGYATANPWFGPRALDELARALDGGLAAVKVHPARQGFALLEDVAVPMWEFVAMRGVPVYVVTGSAMSTPLQLAEVARRYPETAWIMGRSGRVDYGWLDFVRALRQAPNLYAETAHNLPATIGRLIAMLGAQRILFATDLPDTNLLLEMAKLNDIQVDLQADMQPLDAQSRALIMGGNLARLLGPNALTQAILAAEIEAESIDASGL
jgi:hypothetical protein